VDAIRRLENYFFEKQAQEEYEICFEWWKDGEE